MFFNCCEAVHKDRDFEPNVVALLELMKIPFTGANSAALQLCKNKGLTKKILNYHDVRIPEFIIVEQGVSALASRLSGFKYPAMVKPLELDSSEGISQTSLVNNEKECVERIKFLHEKFETDAIVEEFIDGRELYVGILGNQRLTALPPRELVFKKASEGDPNIYTYRAKWDPKYRKKWGIKTEVPKNLGEGEVEKIQELCKNVYRILGITGYARIDLRLSGEGEIVVLEANPNPSIEIDDELSKAAKELEWGYEKLLERVLNLAGV